MDLVKPWLGDVLLNELRQVLQWRDEEDNLQLPRGEIGNLRFEDDGSQLTIQPGRLGQIVQIIKFEETAEPVKVQIADSKIRMTATFSSASTQEYRKKTQQGVHKVTLGGIFQLQEYELRATSFGPKRSQLSLYILKFRYLGAAGSGVFGQIPRSIEDDYDNGAPELLSRVAAQRRKRDSSDSQGASTRQVSPRSNNIHSPNVDFGMPLHGQPQMDSSAFATQLPRVQSTLLVNPPALQITNGFGHSTVHPDKSSMDALGASRSKPSKPTSNAELLEYLADPPSKPPASFALDPLHLSPAKSASSVEDRCIGTKAVPMNNTNLDEHGHHPLAEDRVVNSAAKSSVINSEPLDQNVPIVALIPTKAIESSDTSIVNGTKAGKEKKVTPRKQILNHNSVPNRRRRNGKISMRDIKIPKDQADLLSRQDSWLPSEPGQREPIANVPISILNMLNAKADRRAERAHLAIQGVEDARPPIPEQAQDTLNKSISPEPDPSQSYSWSPSPPRPPPDSSPLASQKGHRPSRISSRSASRSPVQSSKVPTSRSIESMINGDSTTHPHEPSMAEMDSHQPISSADIVNSENSTLHKYQCRASGCTETYTEIPALNRHLKSTHTGKDFGGNVTEDPRSAELSKPSELVKITSPKLGSTAGSFADGNAFASAGDSNEIIEVLSQNATHSNIESNLLLPKSMSPSPSCSSDSELEYAIPRAMDDNQAQQAREMSTVELPSTASYAQIPFTQVKRTPYGNGQIQGTVPTGENRRGSPPEYNNESLVSGTSLESTVYTGLSGSSGHHKTSADWQVNAPSTEDKLGVDITEMNGETLAANDCTKGYSKSWALGDNSSKRKDSNSNGQSSRPVKRPKLSDYFPESMSQDEESPSKLRDRADQHRRDFFTSRRSSATSIRGSNPVSPNKLGISDYPTPLSNMHRTILQGSPPRSEDGAGLVDGNDLRTDEPDHNSISPTFESESNAPTVFAQKTPPHSSVLPGESDTDDVNAGAQFTGSPIGCQITSPSSKHDTNGSNEKRALHDGATAATENVGDLDTEVCLVSKAATSQSLENDGESPLRSPYAASVPAVLGQSLPPLNVLTSRESRLGEAVHAEQPTEHPSSSSNFQQLATKHDSKAMPTKSRSVSPIQLPQVEEDPEVKRRDPRGDEKRDSEILLDRFKAAYPCYLGNLKHFKSLGIRIRRLVEAGGCLQQFLWDDFIIRQKTEYPKYIQQCAEDAEDPLSYERYYTTIPDGPLYTKKIVTARNLDEVFDHRATKATDREVATKRKSENASQPQSNGHDLAIEAALSETVQPLNGPSTESAEISTPSTVVKGDQRRVTIDLTSDEDPIQTPIPWQDENKSRSVDSASKLHRSLPWLTDDDSMKVESPSVTYNSRLIMTEEKKVPAQYKDPDGPKSALGGVKRNVQMQQGGPGPSYKNGQSVYSRHGRKWFQDENTPFNTFVRNYNAIRPGKGNSFANSTDLEHGKKIPRKRKTNHDPQNMLDWIIP